MGGERMTFPRWGIKSENIYLDSRYQYGSMYITAGLMGGGEGRWRSTGRCLSDACPLRGPAHCGVRR